MKKQTKPTSSDQLVTSVIRGMQDMKAEKICLIDLRGIENAVSDYFVICSGNSDIHLQGIYKNVEKEVEESHNEEPWMVEGRTNREWILLDYASVVAHIFKNEKRDFYGLEDLWGDAKIIEISSEETKGN